MPNETCLNGHGFDELCGWDHWLSVSCGLYPDDVRKTTWGKLKSLTNN